MDRDFIKNVEKEMQSESNNNIKEGRIKSSLDFNSRSPEKNKNKRQCICRIKPKAVDEDDVLEQDLDASPDGIDYNLQNNNKETMKEKETKLGIFLAEAKISKENKKMLIDVD